MDPFSTKNSIDKTATSTRINVTDAATATTTRQQDDHDYDSFLSRRERRRLEKKNLVAVDNEKEDGHTSEKEGLPGAANAIGRNAMTERERKRLAKLARGTVTEERKKQTSSSSEKSNVDYIEKNKVLRLAPGVDAGHLVDKETTTSCVAASATATPTDDEDDRARSSQQQPGALHIQGMGTRGTGSIFEEEGTVVYSMGGSNNYNNETPHRQNNDTSSSIVAPEQEHGNGNNNEKMEVVATTLDENELRQEIRDELLREQHQEENDNTVMIVTADPVLFEETKEANADIDETENKNRRRQLFLRAFVFVILAIIVGVVIGAVVVDSGSKGSEETSAEGVLGKEPPTSAPIATSTTDVPTPTPFEGVLPRTFNGANVSLLRDVLPGPLSSSPSFIQLIRHSRRQIDGNDDTTTNDHNDENVQYPFALFVALDQFAGVEPWITDGTFEGTKILSQIGDNFLEGDFFATAYELSSSTNQSNKYYIQYEIDPSESLIGLWVVDFTQDTTEFVTQYRPARKGAERPQLYNDFVFLADDNKLLRVPEGSSLKEDVVIVKEFANSIEAMTVAGENLFISVVQNVDTHDDDDGGLWKSDGTLEGTVLITKEPSKFVSFDRFNFLSPVVGDIVGVTLFFDEDSVWSTDGTTEGTQRIALGVDGSRISPHIVGDDEKMVFTSRIPHLLFVTDGTLDGTQPINVTSAAASEFIRYENMTDYGIPQYGTVSAFRGVFGGFQKSSLFEGNLILVEFVYDEGTYIWVTNGEGATTSIAKFIPNAVPIDGRALPNGQFVLMVVQPDPPDEAENEFLEGPTQLWITDGTDAGTKLLMQNDDTVECSKDCDVIGMLEPLSNDIVLFRGYTEETGFEIFRLEID